MKMKKSLLLGSLLLLGSSMMAQNSIDNAFFDKVKFRGAFGSTDWTNGWANFDPQNTVYPATEKTIAAGNITANTTLGSPLMDAASFTDAALNNSFFTPVNYIGAFGKTDWTKNWANFDPQNTVYPAATVTIPAGNITTNTTWSKTNVYLLNGWVYVKSGATLTIEAGTIIRGDKTNKAAIIVEKGAKIIANGTETEPIVFTSNQPAGSRTYGDWGGIIICGQAPINTLTGSATIEGGVGSTYGGTIANDNSGSLKYVRIEFPGIAFVTNSEINGLTMGGVGSETVIDNIQVSYSGDDSFEWFGGTVNCKHLIALRGWDDDFDTDFGYSGMVQFGVSLRDPNVADVSKSNSFESDNDGSGSANTPLTSPVFCNISSFGPKATSTTSINSLYQSAMHIRRNSKLKIFNSVFAGWPSGLQIDGNATQAGAINGDLKVKNCVLSGMANNFIVPANQTWSATDETNWFNTAAFNNTTYTDNESLALSDPFNLTAPRFGGIQSYLLNGWVYVKSGATLTIKPGVVIRGDKTNKAAIIVEKGGKIIANGTETEPIVFTSNQPAGSRTYGDWGGIILCGQAPINTLTGSATIEGGVGSTYGGTIANDNSGSLKYVRIEFPGIAFVTNSEINGLTMGGVGSETVIDNIQVSYSGDDSFEWFGGTVNCKHLIALRGWDDDFDTDFGYSGMVQYAVALRDPSVADQSKSNCFESDNDGTGTSNTPLTSAIFSNVSSFGPKATATTTINSLYQSAMHIRRNSKLKIFNSVFAGWPSGLQIDGNSTQAGAISGDLKLQNTILAGMNNNFVVPANQTWNLAAERSWYNTASFKNDSMSVSDLNLNNPFNLTAPVFTTKSASKLNAQSYWYFQPASGMTNSMAIVAKANANGKQVTAAGSMLLAYKNGECKGSATIDQASGLFNLSAGSALTSESDVELQLYDAESKKLFLLPTSFDFTANNTTGTSATPVELNATASLNILLNKGFNWISFNVLPENSSLSSVLNYSVQNEDYISSQTSLSTYYNGVWYGMENTGIEKNKMYRLNCGATTPGSIQITNQPLVKNNPVSIINGFNWLGYSLNNAYDINTALSGIQVANEDFIQTTEGSGKTATYYNGVWYGGITMKPGVGYLLKASASSSYDYPKNTISTQTRSAELRSIPNTNGSLPGLWSVTAGYKNTMPIYAQVLKNGSLFQPSGVLLGVFKNGVCYGYTQLIAGPTGNLHQLTMMCNNDTESGFNYKVFDPTNSTTYEVSETVDFNNGVAVGKIFAPIQLHVSNTATGLNNPDNAPFSVFPNPVTSSFVVNLNSENRAQASVELFDMQGRLIETIFNGSITGNKIIQTQRKQSISNGIYLLKVVIGENSYNQRLIFR